MSAVVFDKFYRNIDLRNKLMETGNRYLEETNHWKDRYWGVCDGKGENNLGKILMSVRKFWRLSGKYPIPKKIKIPENERYTQLKLEL